MNHMRRLYICRAFQRTFGLCNLQFKHQRVVKKWKLGIWVCMMESCVVKTGWVKNSYSCELSGLNRTPACSGILSSVCLCHCTTILTALSLYDFSLSSITPTLCRVHWGWITISDRLNENNKMEVDVSPFFPFSALVWFTTVSQAALH